MRRYFTRYLDPARRHPFLLVSSHELKKTAHRVFVKRERLLVAALRGVSRMAAPDPKYPAHVGGDAQARATLNAAYLAALYDAGGDAKRAAAYARLARKGLLAYARMGSPGHTPGYGWLTHLYLVDLPFAYDLVWDLVRWTQSERALIRKMLYVDMDALIEHMHDKHLSNHAAWPMCRMATTGALFGDEALLRQALDGPDSYCVRLAHEFFDDGMNYEQSSTVYQDFSVEPVLITALAARGCGARPDPLTIAVPNDLRLAFRGGSTGDYDMPFYPADTREFPRPRTKTMRLALTAQFDLLRPDTTCPALGDYGGPTRPLADSWSAELAWDLFGDRRAARLLSMGSRRSWDAHMFDEHFLTLVFGRPLPAKTSFPVKSTIYPQAGFAVLRSVEGDAFWKSKATMAVLKFGPYGNGHGHADKLHLDLSGAGNKTSIEELEYASTSWRYWNSTVSHNSVVVGGKSQPGNEEMFALNDSCGRLVYRRFTPKVKIACAEAPDVYKDLKCYRRTVMVADSYVLDVFEVESKKATNFDWFLHGKGAATAKGVVLKRGSLGYRSQGYQFLKGVLRGEANAPVVVRFSEGHAVHVPLAAGATVFTAKGPWKKGAFRPALVIRSRGKRALFVAVHDPSGGSVEATAAALSDGSLEVKVAIKGRTDLLRMPIFASEGAHARHRRGISGVYLYKRAPDR